MSTHSSEWHTVIYGFIRLLDYIVDVGIFLACMLIFFTGLYAVYDSSLVYSGASDESLLEYKPYALKTDDTREKKLEHMVAWLTIDGTPVDFPVMQGKDNMEYLNKDPYGDFSLAGSIFLDSRNHPDFSDPYNLIYGHHMEQDAMFGSLDRYLEEAYFHTHQNGILTTEEKSFLIHFVAVVEAKGDEEAVFSPTEKDEMTIPFLKAHARYIEEDTLPEKGERLIALSTCKYPSTSDRILVFGVLTDPD